MTERACGCGSGPSNQALAVALITLTRYLAGRDVGLVSYLQSSLEHARASHLLEADLAVLHLLVRSIGGE